MPDDMEREEYGYDERTAAETARDAAPRRRGAPAETPPGGRRSAAGDCGPAADDTGAAGGGTARLDLFTGDRVLWIIVAALAVISVLVVYSSTAKMAYDAHTARTTAHFLRQQLMILAASLVVMFAVQKINCRIYNYFARPVYFLSVLLTVAVYFIGATTNGAARWIPLGPFQFQPSEALKVATRSSWPGGSRRSTRSASSPRGGSGPGARRPRSGKSGARGHGRFSCPSRCRVW